MRSDGGVRVFVARHGRGIARPGQWLPRAERYYIFRVGRLDVFVLWKPFAGFVPLSSSPTGSLGAASRTQFVNVESRKMKKLSIGTDVGGSFPRCHQNPRS